MTKDKSLLHSIIFIVVLALLVIFLTGQCILVALFGPNGAIIGLGLNGYPDYIAWMIVSNSKTPSFSDNTVTSEDNLNSLVHHIRNEVSSFIYTSDGTTEMMSLFLNGELRFKRKADGSSWQTVVTGGRLASLIDWTMRNVSDISYYVDAPQLSFDYNYKMENISIKNKGTNAHMTCTISMQKTYFTSLLQDTTNGSKQFLETSLKTDKAYFTLDFILSVEDGVVGSVSNLTTAVNDAGTGASYKLVEYITTHSNGVFENIANDVAGFVKELGHIMVLQDNILVSNN
ncbi:MAG: hypothetical protein IJW28_05825 [Clostridia bacterium]|nr:hypothetical protein [Clostridia bacterium]